MSASIIIWIKENKSIDDGDLKSNLSQSSWHFNQHSIVIVLSLILIPKMTKLLDKSAPIIIEVDANKIINGVELVSILQIFV